MNTGSEQPQPTTGSPVPRKHRRVIRPGAEQGDVAGSSSDERDEGWSESSAGKPESAHDAELRRNLPPHWS